jgi:hypothetical protein
MNDYDDSNVGSLDPKNIRIDLETQSRVTIDPAVVEEYVEAMQNGNVFPPIRIFCDQETDVYVLVDGFHRYFAWLKAFPDTEIPVTVEFRSTLEAQWTSFGVNKDHGLRRTNADKRKAVEGALLFDASIDNEEKFQTERYEFKHQSDRKIAEHVGVSHMTVNRVRAEMVASGTLLQMETRTVTRGDQIYQQNTANIGKSNDKGTPEEFAQKFAKVTNQRHKNEWQRWFNASELKCENCSLYYPEDGVMICGASGDPKTPDDLICDNFDKSSKPKVYGPDPVIILTIDPEQDADLNVDKSQKETKTYKPYAPRGSIRVPLPPDNFELFVQLLFNEFDKKYLKNAVVRGLYRIEHPEEENR